MKYMQPGPPADIEDVWCNNRLYRLRAVERESGAHHAESPKADDDVQ